MEENPGRRPRPSVTKYKCSRTDAYAGFWTSFGPTPSKTQNSTGRPPLGLFPRNQDEEVAMGWPCSANVTHSPTQRCPQMDPNSRRKRGRPKETWRRTAEKEMKEQGWTRGYVERCVADRPLWRALVATYVYDHGGELWWRHMCINARRGLSKFATEQGHLRTTPPPLHTMSYEEYNTQSI